MIGWTEIIIALVTALVPTGGIVAVFTMREKKAEMALNNADKVNKQWKDLTDLEEERRKELKGDLDRKDDKIDELYKEIDRLRAELDKVNSRNVYLTMMKCSCIKCTNREPPFGSEVEMERALLKGGDNGDNQ